MTDPVDLHVDLHDLMTNAVKRVSPEPPPLTRLNAVYRRRHRNRVAIGGVAGALVLAGLGWAVLDGRTGSSHGSVRTGPGGSGAVSLPASPSTPVHLPGEVVIPDLVGLSLAQAERAMPVGGSGARQIVVGAEVVDQSTPPGTVVDQKPPAGATASGVSVTIAVPHSTACTSEQVALTYLGGSASAGTDGGTVVVRDVSSLWCTFSGPVKVVGLDRTGRAVTQTVTVPVIQPYVLSPSSPPPQDFQRPPLSNIEAVMDVLAEYRDGPQPNGLCDTMYVIPADWQLTLPGPVVLSVRNNDPHNDLRGLITCRGQMLDGTPVRFGP